MRKVLSIQKDDTTVEVTCLLVQNITQWHSTSNFNAFLLIWSQSQIIVNSKFGNFKIKKDSLLSQNHQSNPLWICNI